MNRGYFNLLLPQLNRQLLGSITAPSSKYTDGFRITDCDELTKGDLRMEDQ